MSGITDMEEFVSSCKQEYVTQSYFLEKRMDWLTKRIISDNRNLTHDKEELGAIKFSHKHLMDLFEPLLDSSHNQFWHDFFHHFFVEQAIDINNPEHLNLLMLNMYKSIATKPWEHEFEFDDILGDIE